MFKVIGGVHGNEAVTTEMTLQLMQLLLSHHELDDAISRVMKGTIHILRKQFYSTKMNLFT